MIADATVSCDFPGNAFSPVRASYNTAPNEKMSLRPSSSFPSNCSGDMYRIVPRIVPCWVTDEPAGDAIDNVVPPTAVSFDDRVNPKSSSFAPVFVKIMFPGFKSR